MSQGSVQHKAIPIRNDRVNALQYRPGGRLPLKAPLVPVELKPVGEVVGLGRRADQHHGGEELGVAFVLLLLPEDQQKLVAKARMHDDPVRGCGQVHVRGQEDNLCPLKDVDAVGLPQVGHHHLQVPFPRAGEERARAGNQLGVMHRFVVMAGRKDALLRRRLCSCTAGWCILQEERN